MMSKWLSESVIHNKFVHSLYSVAATGLVEPVSLTLNAQNNILYVAEFSANQVRRVFLDATNQESRKEVAVTGISYPDCPALTKDGKILFVGQHAIGSVWRVPLSALGPVAATDLMKIASGSAGEFPTMIWI